MKLGLVAIVCLLQAVITIAQSCPPCPRGFSPCQKCSIKIIDRFTCTRTCTTTCFDFQKDPKNCGSCGKVCKSGEECKGGRCVPKEECKGAVCGSFKRCFGTSCSCYTSPNKQGFCGQDISCRGAKKCNKDDDCRGGTRCALSTCCGFNTCLPNCRKEQGFRFLGLPDAPAPSQGASSSSNQGGSAGGDDD